MKKNIYVLSVILILSSIFYFYVFSRFYSNKTDENIINIGDVQYKAGDVDGNGSVAVGDYILIRKHLLGISKLTGNNLKRADVDGKDGVKTADYIIVRKIILGIDVSSIIQNITPAPTIVPTVRPTVAPTVVPTVKPTVAPTVVPVNKVTKIHFIQTNGGKTTEASDAILIESNGEFGLIDASNPSSGIFSDSSYNGKTVLRYLQNYGVKHLKFIIASHAHSDHIGGIPDIANGSSLVDSTTTFIYKQIQKDSTKNGEIVIDLNGKYSIPTDDWKSTEFLESAKKAMSSKGATLLNTALPTNNNLKTLGATHTSNSDIWMSYINFKMGDLDFKIYNLPVYTETIDKKSYIDVNSNSLVTLITSTSGKKILLSGDLNSRSSYEKYYASKIGKVDILKANHHGYLFSNSRSWIESTKPTYYVVSNSTSNSVFTGYFAAAYTYAKSLGSTFYFTGNGAVVFTIANTITASRTGDSLSIANNWYYWTISENKVWVYIDGGKLVTGRWLEYKKAWYYLNSDGSMAESSWIQDKKGWYYVNSEGKMVASDWLQYNGAWYYFAADGLMMKSNWLSDKDNWYYFGSDGKMLSNTTATINGSSYTFNASGVCTSGKGC